MLLEIMIIKRRTQTNQARKRASDTARYIRKRGHGNYQLTTVGNDSNRYADRKRRGRRSLLCSAFRVMCGKLVARRRSTTVPCSVTPGQPPSTLTANYMHLDYIQLSGNSQSNKGYNLLNVQPFITTILCGISLIRLFLKNALV